MVYNDCRQFRATKVRHGTTMADEENIYVDASRPATLHDGLFHTDIPTLQEAVIAWHRLPPVRQQSATISAGGQLYTAQQINRLHYGPKPTAAEAAEPPVDIAPNFSAGRLTMAHGANDVSAPSTPVAGTAPTETATEIRSMPRANSAAAVEVPALGPIDMSIPPVARESLAASSGGMVSGRAELTVSPGQADPDPIQRTLSDRPIPIANAARALAEEVAAQIAELKQSKPNDPGRLAQYDALIPFLEKLASGLSDLVDALDRLATPGESEPVLLGQAANTARWLQKTVMEWLETNRTMVIDVPVRLTLFGLSVAFVHLLGVDNTAVTASLAYLAGLRSTQPRN
jgi:hypothetical protein